MSTREGTAFRPGLAIRAVLFDWGNTLVRVRGEDRIWQACSRTAFAVLRSDGCELHPGAEAQFATCFQTARRQSWSDPEHREISLPVLLQRWLGDGGVAVPQALLERAVDAFWNAWTTCLELLDRPQEVLHRLGSRGCKIGLVSNVTAPPRYCRRQLCRLGLTPHLDTTTFSSELGLRKPRMEVYARALQSIQSCFDTPVAPCEMLFVGDSPTCDVEAPARLGMRTALIVHPEVKPLWPAEDFRRVTPDIRIARLSELDDHLRFTAPPQAPDPQSA